MMTNYFKLIFCKLYQWIRQLNVDDLPQYTTLSIYSILLSFNALSIVGYGKYFIEGVPVNVFSKVYALMLFLGVMAALYLYFVKKRRYIEFYKNYSKTILNKPISSILTIMYMVLSILLFIGLIWLPVRK
jgi:hypothetical protein